MEFFGVEIVTPGLFSSSVAIGALVAHVQVVSADESSRVCVWNLLTGEKVIQFSASSRSLDAEAGTGDNGGASNSLVFVGVTAMTFDTSYRRLCTASGDGQVKIWNYQSGRLLHELSTVGDGLELSCLAWPPQWLYTGGWGRSVVLVSRV